MADTDSNLIKIGPKGSPSGDPWDEKGCNKIVCIFISHGSGGINSLQFQYEQDGALVLSKCHGTSSGLNFDIVKLDHPREYITGFAGIAYDHLTSLVFVTNKKETCSFGHSMSYTTHSPWFRFNLGSGNFSGFFGSTDSKGVSSLGVYLKPTFTLRTPLKNVLPIEKDSCMVTTGLVGNTYGGDPWDEKDFGKIVRIFISHSPGIINSLQFQYEQNGTLVLSRIRGHNVGNSFDVVELNYPDECITEIRGCVKNVRLYSLVFNTNTSEYGPFGHHKEKGGKEFCFNLGEGARIGGFFGTTDSDSISSLGFYLKPCSTLLVLPKEERP